jgi:hypothetical protein
MSQPLHPQTANAMGLLLQRLAGNPKTRARQLSLIKEVDPNYRLPADVAIEQLEFRHRQERENDKVNHWRTLRANTMKQQRAKLLERYEEAEIKQIEDGVMKKYPNLDYDDAARLHAAETAPAVAQHREAPGRRGQYWEFPSIPGLLENPEKAASDMAYSVIDELRGARR